MLILTRRPGQAVFIKDRDSEEVMCIAVLENKKETNIVKFGIEADKERYDIYRDDCKSLKNRDEDGDINGNK